MSWLNRFLLRIRRGPEFAAIFVITLALGIGANGAVFSALRGYYLAPLPFPQASRLIVVAQSVEGSRVISSAVYDYLHRNTRSFTASGLVHDGAGTVAVNGGEAHEAIFGIATSSWFETLGVHPLLGRTFDRSADNTGGVNEVVLSYRFWQRAMHADRDVLGKTLLLSGRLQTIIGVMPKHFDLGYPPVKFWVQQVFSAADLATDKIFQMHGGRFVARLRPGVSADTATQELNELAERQLKGLPESTQKFAMSLDYHIVTMPLRTSLVGPVGTLLLLIEFAAALVLLLTAAILVNLVTVRTLARRQETALRLALGAGRLDLWRATLSETLPLGLLGGLLAVAVGWWGPTFIAHYGIGAQGAGFPTAPDGWLVLFSVALGAAVGVVAALPAAFAPRKRLLSRLNEGLHGTSGRSTRLTQRSLTVLQITLGVALIVNAILLGTAFIKAVSHPIGVDSAHLVIANMGLFGPRFRNQTSQLGFYRELGAAVRTLPGVKQAGVASAVPFAGGTDSYGVENVAGKQTRKVQSFIEFVDGRALGALGVKLLRGRLIDANDIAAKAPVAVVDTSLAQALFGTTQVLGRDIQKKRAYRVIGVIAPLRWGAQPDASTAGTMWLPYSVAPRDSDFNAGPELDLVVRSGLPITTVRRELDALLQKLAPAQAFHSVEFMRSLQAQAFREDQLMPVLFGLFSLLALVLAGVGTYGTAAYLIRLRLAEFAVRQALGATPARIGLLALAQGAILAAFGVVPGLVVGFLLAHLLSSLIVDVEHVAASAYIVAAAVMALAALTATAVPALHAARGDLTTVLKSQ